MTNHLLDVQDLHVSFDTHAGEVQAVRGVSFWLDAGETLSIVGESGCGKSVTIQTIMKLLPSPPSQIKSGAITYQGTDITHLSDKAMESYRGKEFSMIFQDSMTSLNPTMRVGRQMCEGILRHQRVSRQEAQQISAELLGQVGLPDYLLSRYPHQISGGEGQRLGICRALLLEPEVLLLDEPTSMLDVSVQASIMNLLRELQERLGLTYLYITHDIELLGWISHTIGVMQRGRLVEVGSRDQVMEAPVHPYTRELLYSYTHWEGGGET